MILRSEESLLDMLRFVANRNPELQLVGSPPLVSASAIAAALSRYLGDSDSGRSYEDDRTDLLYQVDC